MFLLVSLLGFCAHGCRLYSFRFLQILMLEEKSSDVQHCQIDLSVDEEMKYGGGRK